MKKTNNLWGIILLLALMIMNGCGNSPKVIETKKAEATGKTTGVFSNNNDNSGQGKINLPTSNSMPSVDEDVHTVKALETIPASRYVYIRVQEGDEEFWLATLKQEVEIGKTYHYHGGLLKTNYRSKEHNKVFDKIYLVSNLISAEHGTNQVENPIQKAQTHQAHATTKVDVAGSVKIADVIANPKKYEGKTVQVSGKCVKLNANIMGRNWLHLQDGSKDNYDFVVTSDQMIPEGSVVTLAGVITLKKDFGAGYFYELIMENGQIVKSN